MSAQRFPRQRMPLGHAPQSSVPPCPLEMTPHSARSIAQVVGRSAAQLLVTTLQLNPEPHSSHLRVFPQPSGTDPQPLTGHIEGWQGPHRRLPPSQTWSVGQVPQLMALPHASATTPHSAPRSAQSEVLGAHAWLAGSQTVPAAQVPQRRIPPHPSVMNPHVTFAVTHVMGTQPPGPPIGPPAPAPTVAPPFAPSAPDPPAASPAWLDPAVFEPPPPGPGCLSLLPQPRLPPTNRTSAHVA